MSETESTEKKIRNIRRQNRKKYSAEEKIRIVIEGLRGDESIAELCRREGIAQKTPIPHYLPSSGIIHRRKILGGIINDYHRVPALTALLSA